MVISFSPKCVLPNPHKIIGLYLLYIYIYIYIEREREREREREHKGTIGFLSNELTKAREKIEP